MVLEIYINGLLSDKYNSNESNEIVIGRSSKADAVIDIEEVSRKHVQLRVEDECIFITDLDSSNGTFINGKRIPSHQEQKITRFDNFKIGPIVEIRFRELGQETSNFENGPAKIHGASDLDLGHMSELNIKIDQTDNRQDLNKLQQKIAKHNDLKVKAPDHTQSSFVSYVSIKKLIGKVTGTFSEDYGPADQGAQLWAKEKQRQRQKKAKQRFIISLVLICGLLGYFAFQVYRHKDHLFSQKLILAESEIDLSILTEEKCTSLEDEEFCRLPNIKMKEFEGFISISEDGDITIYQVVNVDHILTEKVLVKPSRELLLKAKAYALTQLLQYNTLDLFHQRRYKRLAVLAYFNYRGKPYSYYQAITDAHKLNGFNFEQVEKDAYFLYNTLNKETFNNIIGPLLVDQYTFQKFDSP